MKEAHENRIEIGKKFKKKLCRSTVTQYIDDEDYTLSTMKMGTPKQRIASK